MSLKIPVPIQMVAAFVGLIAAGSLLAMVAEYAATGSANVFGFMVPSSQREKWSDCHEFTPRPDISTFELAMILKHTSGYGGLKLPVCFKSGAFGALDPSIQRHFSPSLAVAP